MKFCLECENLLYPQKGVLYCRTCGREHPMPKEEERARKIMKQDKSFLYGKPIFVERNKEINRLIKEENNKVKFLDIKPGE